MALVDGRVLLSNDDGINAPGLEVLEDIAATLGLDAHVVAPETEQSGAGHSLTLHMPLRIREIEAQRHAVSGTPTDCVLLAVNSILQDDRPSLVLSGVNRGANLGEDVTYSGTIAAAMEATLFGIPAIALSQQVTSDADYFETARHWAPRVVEKLVQKGWPRNVLMNVNFPPLAPDEVKGIALVSQGRRKIGDQIVPCTDPRGRPYYWIGTMREEDKGLEGTDVWAINNGWISVTPIQMDMTDTRVMAAMEGLFG